MEKFENVYMKVKSELDIVFAKLGMDRQGLRRDVILLKELILIAVQYPDCWERMGYSEQIGMHYGITRERVRQIFYKTVWDNWSSESAIVLEKHFDHSIEKNFKCVKPDHVEFVNLLSSNLRKKYDIGTTVNAPEELSSVLAVLKVQDIEEYEESDDEFNEDDFTEFV